MNDSRIYRNTKIARYDSVVKLGWVTDVAFHSTPRKRYQSKLLVVLSKGGRCNFIMKKPCQYLFLRSVQPCSNLLGETAAVCAKFQPLFRSVVSAILF